MGKILKNGSGQVFVSSGNALEVTAAIDSNIVAGNIKKDVEILGVIGTYEGSGGGGATLVSFALDAGGKVFYTNGEGEICSYDVPGETTLSCLSGSTLIYFCNMDAATFSNCTLIQSVSMGSRANYNPVKIYQVG